MNILYYVCTCKHGIYKNNLVYTQLYKVSAFPMIECEDCVCVCVRGCMLGLSQKSLEAKTQ